MSEKYYDDKNKELFTKLKHISTLLPSFCSDFLIGIEMRTCELTRLNYARDILLFFTYLIENCNIFQNCQVSEISASDLDKLKAIDIERYLSYTSFYTHNDKILKNKERGKARKLSAIKSLFKYLYKNSLLSSDVSSMISAPRIHDKPIVRLENNEVNKLLDNVESNSKFNSKRQDAYNLNTQERDLAIISLFLGTGLRVSELVGLDLDDINFLDNSLMVTRKGGNRSIQYFTTEVKEILEEYLPTRSHLLDKAGKHDEKALFISLQNSRISVRAVQNIVKKFAKLASPLKNISPHKLRSTFGTTLYRSTQDIYAVAEILGHRDVNTTKKHYAAMSESIKREASKKIKLRNHDNPNNDPTTLYVPTD
ncbi:MAG: tyrosine-type recombinase/integrase [Christensenellaceae bacterium]|jgi:site-specific recombinase XerD|nr:tyrosine-type recombinase/integrase [Christensenellaceae bacterium]